MSGPSVVLPLAADDGMDVDVFEALLAKTYELLFMITDVVEDVVFWPFAPAFSHALPCVTVPSHVTEHATLLVYNVSHPVTRAMGALALRGNDLELLDAMILLFQACQLARRNERPMTVGAMVRCVTRMLGVPIEEVDDHPQLSIADVARDMIEHFVDISAGPDSEEESSATLSCSTDAS